MSKLTSEKIAPRIADTADGQTPGLRRLRRSKDAEAIRQATLADNEQARAHVAAKLAAVNPQAKRTGATTTGRDVSCVQAVMGNTAVVPNVGTMTQKTEADVRVPASLEEKPVQGAFVPEPYAPRPGSKAEIMLFMVCRPEGAAEMEIADAIGWPGGCSVTLKRNAAKAGIKLVLVRSKGRGVPSRFYGWRDGEPVPAAVQDAGLVRRF